MREVFRISVADSVTLVNKLQKFKTEDWSEQYSDEIFDKMYDTGYDLSESVDYDMNEDSIKFYFLTNEHKTASVIETTRNYTMRADEHFIGSYEFYKDVEDRGFADVIPQWDEVEIVNVTHDDFNENVIYDIRKLTTDGGKHETVLFTDDYMIECIKKEKEEDDDGDSIFGSHELSGDNVIEIPSELDEEDNEE